MNEKALRIWPQYHEGVLGKKVPARNPGCPGRRVRVRRGGTATEPTTDSPDYKDSVQKIELEDLHLTLKGTEPYW